MCRPVVFQSDLTCLRKWGVLPCHRPAVAPQRPGDVNGPLSVPSRG